MAALALRQLGEVIEHVQPPQRQLLAALREQPSLNRPSTLRPSHCARLHHRRRELPGGPAVITVLVAEDHPLVRRGIVGFLSTQPDLTVVAEAADGAEAVRLAVEHCPDVAVIDLQLPRLDGVEAIRRLTRDCPDTRVVVLTSHAADADIFPAIHAGALSYLLKEATPDELAQAVRAAATGEAMLRPRVAARVVAELGGGRLDAPTRCAT